MVSMIEELSPVPPPCFVPWKMESSPLPGRKLSMAPRTVSAPSLLWQMELSPVPPPCS
jgi:hypothetical protein